MEQHVSGQSNKPLPRPPHALPAEEVARLLEVNIQSGLRGDEAARRREEFGPNELLKEKNAQPLKILLRQVVNAMTLVLVLALAASFGIEAYIEGGVIAGIICLNIIIGFVQDYQAACTIDALGALTSPSAKVIREDRTVVLDSADLVPGDIVELKMGDSVPADIRLIEAVNFETDEALLTGESLPIRKDPSQVFDDDTGPGDRLNAAFSSSTVTKGRARGIVFATGMYTEIGLIAAALLEGGSGGKHLSVRRDESGKVTLGAYFVFAGQVLWKYVGSFLGLTVGTPLQRKLSKLFLYVFGFAIVCAMVVLGANKFNTRNDVIIYAVATGVGTLPVSLILVLTITLAAGTKAMVDRNVVVRHLSSLEALGGVTNICSDKTGTLTQGRMVVRMAWLPGLGTYSVDNAPEPYNPTKGEVKFTPSQPVDMRSAAFEPKIHSVNAAEEPINQPMIQNYLNIASLANLASVQREADDGEKPGAWVAHGDPTEIALQVFVTRFGWNRLTLSTETNPDARWKQLAELPFDSEVKRMSVVVEDTSSPDREVHIFTKGATERVLGCCTTIAMGRAEPEPLTEKILAEIHANMEALARLGLRVLALASKSGLERVTEAQAMQGLNRLEFEKDLVLRGLVGIYDPPRPESLPSVRACHRAGISVHMLTGDHPHTARAIAAEVAILPTESRMSQVPADVAKTMVMTAHEFDSMTDDEIDLLPQLPLVVARCSPTTKVRMIEALHRRGKFVAMTGDGVNDSPSLKYADVGIAMGMNGSDVAKNSSDIILTDDNFASILNAIDEGRRIFDNIQKFILHVLAANVGFVIALLTGLAFKDADGISIFQITPVEILFMLLVAGAFTETGLGFEQASPDILRRPPQNLKYGVFTPEFVLDLTWYGIVMSICILGSFIVVLFGFNDGNFGHDCNLEYSDSCNGVFRARATAYTTMMWVFLFFAWELIDSRRSLFDGLVRDPKSWALVFWRNQFLFWSVVVGFFLTVVTLYIPVLDTVVFMHKGITWEWAVVVVSVAVFFSAVESWKWGKRVYFRRNGGGPRKDDEEGYMSTMSTDGVSIWSAA
ncbi:probable Na+-transporting ATPase ENA-1 (sodium P-type ATPase ENA-1) [Cephalotrichum gorgonifer]|uniref:P-type Na(+) transporter n=1 Tax=Cephalotrichum gorgonifer TaxID=2041049 RepID=A0AAE8SZ87_9PEZI|nr:probable Na+-transporting ATPase ENA-1 (sodium P-type ATPase ENA-1) [Cephalotrichum gorgonifer]